MSNGNQSPMLVQQKRTIADLINSDKTRLEIAKVLPKHLTPERMCRVALTATMRNPNLLQCTPASLMNALLTCSQAGLEPDGRLAHLIPYKDVVQVIFDYKGLVTLALRNGAEAVYADKVCEFDDFQAYVENGAKKLTHRPNWSKPRGTATCYYAVCKRGGEVDWEVMTVEEVEAIRKRSRAANNGPWVTDFDEMGKKTVLRRMSKRWDLLPEIRDVINADDDTPPPFNQSVVSTPVFAPRVVGNESPVIEAPAEAVRQPEPAEPEHDDGDLGPQPPVEQKQAEPVGNGKPNYLKGVRNLCSAGKIKEGELLGFLAEIGTTDGSVGSLEDLVLTQSDTLRLVYDNWSGPKGISTQIIAARKEGAK